MNNPNKNKISNVIDLNHGNEAVMQVINDFNKIYTTLAHGGKNYVLRHNTDSFNQKSLEFFSYKDFVEFHRDSPKIQVDVKSKDGSIVEKDLNPANVWLDSPCSKSAKFGLTFHPESVEFHKGKLNTYMGLGCNPIEYHGEDPLIAIYLSHIFVVICDSDMAAYEYLIGWLAHMIQKPCEKPGVAIVLKAGQGTGKGTFVDALGKIIGSHYLHATSAEQIVGKFNAQLENKVLVFGDEMFIGAKSATDRMKTMITEPMNTIERKGQDRITVPCCARIIMATNHNNVIKIEKDERRYLYLEVSEVHKQDVPYFDRLHGAINDPEFTGKLLHFLLSHDISNFNPRAVPKTKALTEQKIDNLDPLYKWIYTVLKSGEFSGNWPERLKNDEVNKDAEDWLKSQNLTVWGDIPRQVGRLLTLLGAESKQLRTGKDGDREYWREFPKLESIRVKFAEVISADMDW